MSVRGHRNVRSARPPVRHAKLSTIVLQTVILPFYIDSVDLRRFCSVASTDTTSQLDTAVWTMKCHWLYATPALTCLHHDRIYGLNTLRTA